MKIEDEFAIIYKQVEIIAAELVVTPALPGTVTVQQHQKNVASEDRVEYYRQAVAIPLIDRFIQ